MMEKVSQRNSVQIAQAKEILGEIEENILQKRLYDSMVEEITEMGYWANEILQTRISLQERKELLKLLDWVKYLQKLYLKMILDLRVVALTQELRSLISDDAWRVFLRLDEVRNMENDYFCGDDFYLDRNLDLIQQEKVLHNRLKTIGLRTY